MKILACSINLFEDRDIVRFLNKDFDSNYIQDLRQTMALQQERLERMDMISASRSSGSK